MVLLKKNFPEITSLVISLPAPYCAMLLSHYDQIGGCAMQLQKQSSSSKSRGACMALSASLSGRISLGKAGTHECLVIKRHKVQGELVEYDEQREMLASIKTTKSKTWTAAMCFKPDGSHISITFDMLLPEPGKQPTRSVVALCRILCRAILSRRSERSAWY